MDKNIFNVGDFVACNNGILQPTLMIVGVFGQNYLVKTTNGEDCCPTIEYLEKHYRRWNIADAKDGDVLAYPDGSLSIFKYRLKGLDAGLYMAHVVLTDKIETKQTCTIKDVQPATKEQRDTLFAKMREAGYEWDAENKKLKKIEQRPTYKVEPKSDFELCLKHIIEEAIECGDTHNLKADAELLYNMAQKSAEWDEEDESILQGILDEILANKHNAKECEWKTYDKFLDWLKSLRPQPKQDWSEEDEIMRIHTLQTIKKYWNSLPDTEYSENEISESCYNWLNSLKGIVQPKQEWSEEDERMIISITHHLERQKNYQLNSTNIEQCQDWLKSIRPQSTWKPSEEQISVLEQWLKNKQYDGDSRYVYPVFQSLYEQLKSL